MLPRCPGFTVDILFYRENTLSPLLTSISVSGLAFVNRAYLHGKLCQGVSYRFTMYISHVYLYGRDVDHFESCYSMEGTPYLIRNGSMSERVLYATHLPHLQDHACLCTWPLN
jgi:hypothetical protein